MSPSTLWTLMFYYTVFSLVGFIALPLMKSFWELQKTFYKENLIMIMIADFAYFSGLAIIFFAVSKELALSFYVGQFIYASSYHLFYKEEFGLVIFLGSMFIVNMGVLIYLGWLISAAGLFLGTVGTTVNYMGMKEKELLFKLLDQHSMRPNKYPELKDYIIVSIIALILSVGFVMLS